MSQCPAYVLIGYTAWTANSGWILHALGPVYIFWLLHTQHNILHALYSFTFKSRVNISSNETFEWDGAIKAWNWAREHELGKIFLHGWRWGSISGGGFDVKVNISSLYDGSTWKITSDHVEVEGKGGAIGGSEEASGNDENLILTIMKMVMGVVVR